MELPNWVQVFPENSELPNGPVKFGIDPTLDRIHLGHFVPLRLAKKLADSGRSVVLVLGTFTATLGDPSGRNSTRPMIRASETVKNAKRIVNQIRLVMKDSGVTFWHNHRLHAKMSMQDFMQHAAKFTVNFMLSRNSFQERYQAKNPIGLHELLVPICQGLDSVELHAAIEIGGLDQLFNFQVSRMLQEQQGQKPQVCLMTPIINGTDGRKMSKSFGNCVFLDDPPDEIFGKVMSISDQTMSEWMPLFLDRDVDAEKNPLLEKMSLAQGIVAQIYDEDAAARAVSHFNQTVRQGQVPDSIPTMSAATLLEAVVKIRACSKTQARKLIEQGACYVDQQKTLDPNAAVVSGQTIKAGHRCFVRIE